MMGLLLLGAPAGAWVGGNGPFSGLDYSDETMISWSSRAQVDNIVII
jgi:hypothetical protein